LSVVRASLCGLSSAIALIIAMAVAAGCGGVSTGRVDKMEIELDAFSGRPNPKWIATPERAASISRGLSSLPGASSTAGPEPGHLGYRGFIIRQGGLRARVYGGHVTATANGTTGTFVDSAGLEAQLIADATERGFGEIIGTLR
jgi:hypothetical protein